MGPRTTVTAFGIIPKHSTNRFRQFLAKTPTEMRFSSIKPKQVDRTITLILSVGVFPIRQRPPTSAVAQGPFPPLLHYSGYFPRWLSLHQRLSFAMPAFRFGRTLVGLSAPLPLSSPLISPAVDLLNGLSCRASFCPTGPLGHLNTTAGMMEILPTSSMVN